MVQHSELEHFLANEAAGLGNEVFVIRCSRTLMPKCQGMNLRVDTPENRRISCDDCETRGRLLTKKAGYTTKYLDDFLRTEDFELADREVRRAMHSDWRNFSFDGIPFGRFWGYVPSIHFKTTDLGNNPQALSDYWETARGNLLAYMCAKRIAADFAPDFAFVYSFEYPANRSFLAGLSSNTTQVSFNHGWASRRFSTVEERLARVFSDPVLEAFESGSMTIPVSRRELTALRQNLSESLQGKNLFSYSPGLSKRSPSNVRQGLGLSSKKKVILFLLSSPDEIDAGNLAMLRPEHRYFDDELDLARLVGPVARQFPASEVVVRLHPRLYPDRRVEFGSDRLEETLSLIEEAPNVTLNVPSDGIGLFDVAGIASVAISTRSSSAWELGAMGLPVVFTDPTRDPTNTDFSRETRLAAGSSTYTLAMLRDKIQDGLEGNFSRHDRTKIVRFLVTLTVRSGVPLYGARQWPKRELASLRRHTLSLLKRVLRRLAGPLNRLTAYRRWFNINLESHIYRLPRSGRSPMIVSRLATPAKEYPLTVPASQDRSGLREMRLIQKLNRFGVGGT